jgi:hypothetical protein
MSNLETATALAWVCLLVIVLYVKRRFLFGQLLDFIQHLPEPVAVEILVEIMIWCLEIEQFIKPRPWLQPFKPFWIDPFWVFMGYKKAR